MNGELGAGAASAGIVVDPLRAAISAGGEIPPPASGCDAQASLGATQAAVLRGVVETLAFGIAVIDDDWRIAYANRAAASMLDSDRALTVESGRIVIRPREAGERIRAWLRDAAGARPAVAVARASGAPPFLFEYLSPLADAAGDAAHVLALLDTGRPPAADAERLVEAFGLTRSEARLAAALAEGQTLQEFAQRQRVSVATARTHLESVYAKTGARRQAQVVRLAMACAGPFARRTPPPNSGVDRADKFLAIGS